jgi:hypothetical protein
MHKRAKKWPRFIREYFCTYLGEFRQAPTTVLKNTVLNKVVEGLQVINDGSRFIVRSDNNGSMSLRFTQDDNEEIICDVPIYLYIDGDMNFFAQMLG